ncbi:hypothetical protein GH714_002948 [Hevea brasiliensis]|uniref:CNNM transmembrane domain-containing protein n=1 Tax=Hevea brasiliensis TaxID=3981 RepID=A0A6A6KIV2_HEVBR|nr:hypothetical protein GH714_002948 [Hevea brasiliensis]
MSGLTLGLMSLGLVDLEILQRSGTSSEKKQAAAILPVVQKQHQLLVTLLLCNAASMEALPIYLDKLFNQYVAIILSVTFVLFFGEILDWVLGHNEALFRRAQLKALVSIHGQEAGKGGELTHDETTIISGALDLTEKTAEEAMTPIESTFSLDVNSKLDWEAMGKVLARGHSRVPVYSGNPKNIIGLLLVKSLLTVRPETETPVSAVSIRRIPRVPSDMPLYDILNEFQKGSSHMAAVVKSKTKTKVPLSTGEKVEENKANCGDSQLTTPLLAKQQEKSDSVVVDINRVSRPSNINKQITSQCNDTATNGLPQTSEYIEDGEVIGIITLEDVFEELLQEEIVDETDEYVDVHRRIRVAAAAAASSVARAPSSRRLTVNKGAGGQSKPGQTLRKSENDSSTPRLLGAAGILLYLLYQFACYLAAFTFSGILFLWFNPSGHDCGLNVFFIVMTMIIAFAFAIIALHPTVNGSLLPASVISVYCAYVCYTGLSSEPRDYVCNGLHNKTKAVSTSTLVLGMLTTVLSVLYSAVRAGSSTTFYHHHLHLSHQLQRNLFSKKSWKKEKKRRKKKRSLSRKCEKSGCKGLKKAMEFDLQLQTEDCVKSSGAKEIDKLPWKGGSEGNPDYECLRAELRKMAPPNGRAVLLFRARCGCPIAKLEGWGLKKGRRHKKALANVAVNGGDHR